MSVDLNSPDPVAPIPVTDPERDAFRDAIAELRVSNELLKNVIESQRDQHNMELAAISTATVQNTETSIKERIDRANPFWTVAYGDVCVAVDREMKLRAECERLRGELAKRDEPRLPEKYAGATPGEWGIDDSWEENLVISGDGGEGVCMVALAPESAALGLCSQTRLKNHQRNRRAKANARLIADAPQLAADNEKLRIRLAGAEALLADSVGRVEALRRENAELKDRAETGESAFAKMDAFASECREDRDRLSEQVRVLREALTLVQDTDGNAIAELKKLGLDYNVRTEVMDAVDKALSATEPATHNPAP